MGRIYSGILSNVTESLPTDWHSHFLHCIDYLRQAVMCAADVSLEVHGPNDSDDLGPLDGGWSGQHGKYMIRSSLSVDIRTTLTESSAVVVCKDYTQVMGYLEG